VFIASQMRPSLRFFLFQFVEKNFSTKHNFFVFIMSIFVTHMIAAQQNATISK